MSPQRVTAEPMGSRGILVHPLNPDAGGTAPLDGCGGVRNANFRTDREFGKFRYTQKKIATTRMPAVDWPNSLGPRNTVEVQSTTGTQIRAIEAETQKACRRLPIRPA
jgi:hypothetical protein